MTPHLRPSSEDSRVRWAWGRRAGAGQVPQLLPGGSTADRVFSVSISSRPVTATPFSPCARGCPGPQKPECPVCWPWCLWGQLKDPWCGHSTRLLTEEPWLVLGKVFLLSPSAPLLAPYLCGPRFQCVWFSSKQQVHKFRGVSGCWISGHFHQKGLRGGLESNHGRGGGGCWALSRRGTRTPPAGGDVGLET